MSLRGPDGDKRRPWGWGTASTAADAKLLQRMVAMLSSALSSGSLDATLLDAPPTGANNAQGALDRAISSLPVPGVALPPRLRRLTKGALNAGARGTRGSGGSGSAADVDAEARVRATYGCSLRDCLRAAAGDWSSAPDAVLFPAEEAEVAAVLRWASTACVAVATRGGGTSVVSGAEAASGALGAYRGCVSVDMSRMDQLLTLDKESGLARVQGGMLGPDLEAALGRQGYTLRFFPQSFGFSSVGGWVATRAGGHFATGPTHIDDLVCAARVVTPSGTFETRRLPASGAGPDPLRALVLGSEGTLGIITEVVLRVQPRPRFRAAATLMFPTFEQGCSAVRAITQTGVQPSNLRLVCAEESMFMGLGDGSGAMLLTGFESPAIDDWTPQMKVVMKNCYDFGGTLTDDTDTDADGVPRTRQGRDGARDGGAGEWRRAFISAPYLRDELALRGFVCETFETAVCWSNLRSLLAGVQAAVEAVFEERCGGNGVLTVRITHAYRDGCAPYFTVLANCAGASGSPEHVLEVWDAIKLAASDALQAHGATCTHHHAVGRDHAAHYAREVGPMVLKAYSATKAVLDPAWILNPGVLLPLSARPAPGASSRL